MAMESCERMAGSMRRYVPNFICRRGPVHRLRSDNGRNFVGADREAKRFAEIFEPERIQSELSSKGIEWIFNCPANPSEGGVWDRMVQCVKRVLRHTVKEVAPKEHVLESSLIEAENFVNSRPLTHLPVSADQKAPLTPNDLLNGAACPPDTPGLDGGLVKEGATRKQWRVARMLRNRFWKRWVLEYLPTLTRREKWCRREKPIQPFRVETGGKASWRRPLLERMVRSDEPALGSWMEIGLAG
ncbi:uncharacterized protein LOC123258143 [Drosophila ananassae]|uniref:uncharacterized protein LOC123258143 n=1 Tax=Drosophila ananassae TaxID=7217 RepID=UPI001D000701|nr:uncharacterized protein LOC123258143 [Drosophila ananassae]